MTCCQHGLFFAATQPLRPAIKSLLLTVLVLIEVFEQSLRSLFKVWKMPYHKDNRTEVLSSLADVALGLPDDCLFATFPESSFFFNMFCTAQRLIFSFFGLFENTPLRSKSPQLISLPDLNFFS